MEMPPGPPVSGQSVPPSPRDAGREAPIESVEAGPPGLLADEAANRRLVATTAALALVVVAAMILGFLLTRDREEGSASVPVDESATGEPDEVAVDAADLDALVADLQAVVEEERDLEFQEAIPLELLDDDAYVERSQEDFEEDLMNDREEIENAAAALRALGLWPEEGDPVDIVSRYLSVGSLGYYDPETGEMVVRGTADTPNLRITLVHELTHALEDQHVELDRRALQDRPDESGFAFSALVEGSASRVEAAYTASLTGEERAEAEAEQLEYLDGVDAADFPPILLEQQRFVYVTGAVFVAALHADGGNAALDRALRRPPTTSEQIQEPETWPDRDPVVEVEAPDADGEVVEEGVVGQFLVHALTSLSDDEPTPEWDGDNSVLWQDGDRDCLRMAVVGDLEALEIGLTPWAEQAGAEMEVDGDRLVVTSCR